MDVSTYDYDVSPFRINSCGFSLSCYFGFSFFSYYFFSYYFFSYFENSLIFCSYFFSYFSYSFEKLVG
jgi:hypothetical protein